MRRDARDVGDEASTRRASARARRPVAPPVASPNPLLPGRVPFTTPRGVTGSSGASSSGSDDETVAAAQTRRQHNRHPAAALRKPAPLLSPPSAPHRTTKQYQHTRRTTCTPPALLAAPTLRPPRRGLADTSSSTSSVSSLSSTSSHASYASAETETERASLTMAAMQAKLCETQRQAEAQKKMLDTAAAVRIQTLQRGRQGRREYADHAARLQRCGEELAATRIQASYRGSVGKRESIYYKNLARVVTLEQQLQAVRSCVQDQHTLLSRVSSRKLVPPPDLKSGLVRHAREGNPQPELGPEKRSRKTLPRLELPGKRSANVFDTKIEPVLSAITASADFAGMTLTELGLSTAPKI